MNRCRCGCNRKADRGRRGSDRSSTEGVANGDDCSSVSSENFSKDVAILNCCFDDIERFIARLQHTAQASKELERRLNAKSKKHVGQDGILSMRAKPPPEKEFFEILQKFKLSFNMLGKLRSYIHEPNAPELVHFIFSPLALIVDASIDSNYGADFPARVLSPLLTLDAVNLLTNCMTSAETELWQSLGDCWRVPKEHWKYPVPPYQPVFSSGWKPELSEDNSQRPGTEEEFFENGQPSSDNFRRSTNYSESDTSGSDLGSGGDRAWLQELKAKGARVAQVIYPRTASNAKELTVVRGELLEVVDDSRRWWKCTNSRGQNAHVPHTIVTPYVEDQESPKGTGPGPQPPRKYKGKFRYV